MRKPRNKSWQTKVDIVHKSFLRASTSALFAPTFYDHLFFLHPPIREYFKETDFVHQHKAIMHGLEFVMGFLDGKDTHARNQIMRIAQTHSKAGMDIHPHHYYYWLEALILTTRDLDSDWSSGFEYYFREVISFPVSFIVSQYFQINFDQD
jgi:hemoglobin-like flavoprotein